MKFTYRDADYELIDPNYWTTLEAMKLQQYTGLQPFEIVVDLRRGGSFGLHASVWLSLRRAGVDVAWDDLEMPHFDTITSLRGEPVEEPPDPSSASTRRRSASPGRRQSSAPSKKN